MMQRLLLSIVFAVAGFWSMRASAQERAPAAGNELTIDVHEAMRLGEENAESVGIAGAGVARARAQIAIARGTYFPQVYGSASYQRTIATEFDGLFDAPAGMPGQPEEDTPALPFGRDNTYRVGVSATQDVFNGGRTGAQVDLAQAGKSQAMLGLEEARAQSVLTATEVYYDAILSQRLVEIAESTLAQAEATLGQTQAAFAQGVQPEFDVLRAEVARDNQRSLVVQRASERDLALLRLRLVLGIPKDRQVRLSGNLEDPESATVAAAAREVAGISGEGPRAPVSLAKAQVSARAASVDLARAARLPTIQLALNLGFVNYPQDPWPMFDDWRTNFTVGVSLQVPIFTGGQLINQVRAAQADLLEAELRLQDTAEQSELQVARAAEQIDVAVALWRASLRTQEQAQRAYEIAQQRFEQGVSTQLELTDARVLLEQARVNQARAARDVLVAQVRMALLPKLPLGVDLGSPPPSGASAPTQVQQPPVRTNASSSGTGAGQGSNVPGF